MFSYMIGTGPAEELFSRGFLQDQAARAFPLWQAMVFSAFLFAIGHLPISILMHKMGFVPIMWYMVTLFVMGLFFGLIYQWSRNIVFPILIHGLWDWYLTLFAIKGEFSYDFASNAESLFGMMDFINTMITLAIVTPLFYLIYRKFWRRNILSTGSPEDTSRETNRIIGWIKERDLGDWPRAPITTTIAVTGVFCLLMLPFAAVIGTNDPDLQDDRVTGGGGEVIIVTEQYRDLFGSELQQGESDSVEIGSANITLNWVNITMNWDDEPDAGPRYTNAPDGFRLSLMDSRGQTIDSIEGTTGGLSIVWIHDENTDPVNNVTIIVELTVTGDQEPFINIIGLREISDNSNTYGLDVKYEVSYSMKEGEEDLNVRW
jgi:hypothetical protein